MERVDIRFVKGNRKNDLAELNGYLFERNRPILTGYSYRCLNHKSNSCPARVHVIESGNFFKGEHTHTPKPEREIITSAKSMVSENRLITTGQVMERIEQETVEKKLPSYYLGSTESIKRSVRYHRNHKHGDFNLGNTRSEIQILANLTKSVRDSQFLLYVNNGDDNRMLIFATRDAIDKLAYCDVWLVDGTFKSCPSLFAQIYTIHGIYRNSYAVPLVYAYLPGKSYGTYLEFFQTIHRFVPGEPTIIISDFELAAIQAGRDTFITTEMNGCLFHLTQSVFRQVQNNPSVIERYNSLGLDGNWVRSIVRSLGALAFVRTTEVAHAFMEIRSTIPAGDPVREIFQYFQANYIGNDWEDVRFPVQFWNVRSRFENLQPRTNNAKEGWHFRFNNLHSKVHPSLNVSIQMIQKEENHFYVECDKIKGGLVPGRKRKNFAIDQQLRNILQNQEAQVYHNHAEFLQAVQMCLHFFIQE